MNLEELYKEKGELVTKIEVCQGKLQNINNQIVRILNKQESERLNEPTPVV